MITDTTSSNRKEALTRLYKKAFPKVATFVSRHGGSLADAREVFHDAIILSCERQGQEAIREPEAYLYGMVRNLWYRRFRNQAGYVRLEDDDALPFAGPDPQPSRDRLLQFLEKAGRKCMDLLKAVYYDGLKMQSVSERFGFSGPRSATVQKHKCMEKVREHVKRKQMAYEDFLD